MKICGIICEYNPLHNGHAYQIHRAKELSGADFVVCVMSGNFVQRGEAAIFDKSTRAKHAILAGADAVVELPVPFAVSSAEFFAKGAIKLLTSIPAVTHLCFGTENDDVKCLVDCAKTLNDEPEEVSFRIRELMNDGTSFAKARCKAYEGYFSSELLTKPNNILAVEYVKALLQADSKIRILPVKRVGSCYSEQTLAENFSSATAIREAIKNNRILDVKNNVPEFVFLDLPHANFPDLDVLEKYSILSSEKRDLANILDCAEGLENAFKAATESNADTLEHSLTNARYTSSRIRRIGLHALLKIKREDVTQAVANDSILNILAVKKGYDTLLSELGRSKYPLLVKNGDYKKLSGETKRAYELQSFADCIYALACKRSKSNSSPFID